MEKYPELRFLASLLRIIGRVATIIGAIVLLLAIMSVLGASGDQQTGIAAVGGIMGASLGSMVILFGLITAAFGEIIRVVVDIEANTRRWSARGSTKSSRVYRRSSDDATDADVLRENSAPVSEEEATDDDVEIEMARRELERRGIKL